MGQRYPYSAIWTKNTVVTIHIYGGRAIFLLFFDHQDTESEWSGIEMSIYQPILTHKKIAKALWDNKNHTLKNG